MDKYRYTKIKGDKKVKNNGGKAIGRPEIPIKIDFHGLLELSTE
tara:strand:+ start:381965 stop:382096 length:132 start_codon:yes stop_codon:yes gene_type:complete